MQDKRPKQDGKQDLKTNYLGKEQPPQTGRDWRICCEQNICPPRTKPPHCGKQEKPTHHNANKARQYKRPEMRHVKGEGTPTPCNKSVARSVFAENSLQGTPVHAQTAGSFRDIPPALLVDALNMLPSDAVCAHRVLWRWWHTVT